MAITIHITESAAGLATAAATIQTPGHAIALAPAVLTATASVIAPSSPPFTRVAQQIVLAADRPRLVVAADRSRLVVAQNR